MPGHGFDPRPDLPGASPVERLLRRLSLRPGVLVVGGVVDVRVRHHHQFEQCLHVQRAQALGLELESGAVRRVDKGDVERDEGLLQLDVRVLRSNFTMGWRLSQPPNALCLSRPRT